jgi:hypothetical protein
VILVLAIKTLQLNTLGLSSSARMTDVLDLLRSNNTNMAKRRRESRKVGVEQNQ